MFIPIKENECSLTVDKSTFIAVIIPFNDINNLNNELDRIKKKYDKAKHYLYAYKIDGVSKSNDDNEPGSISKCFLEIINKQNLNKILIVVVRYFGGTLLGASRLLRTYVNVVTEAIKITQLGKEENTYIYFIETDYATFNKIKALGYHIDNVSYFDTIKLDIISTDNIEDALKSFKVKINKIERKIMVI